MSYDHQHDSHAVAKFVAAANEHLLQVRGLVIEKKTSSLMAVLRNISLKHPLPIYNVSFSNEDLGFHVERHYTGCRHGKGPLDGAGAVVKSGARRAAMGMNIIINSTEEFFIFGKENLKTTFLFDFFLQR